MTITTRILGKEYTFNPLKDSVIKRGILDPYLLSDNDNEWVVLDEYIFWSVRLYSAIIIPRWFITDLASIPKGFRWMISVNERHRLASLPHDFGYALAGLRDDHPVGSMVSRLTWDEVLLDFCKQQSVPWFKRHLMYGAVRVGGWANFGKVREMYIPMKDRVWYQKAFPQLSLDVTQGPYIPL